MRNIIFNVIALFLFSGCGVLDNVSAGDRRIPVSNYASEKFDELSSSLKNVRVVYEKDRKDIFTYVIGFDGTNNSGDCEMIIGVEPNVIDYLTNKSSCTTVRRFKEEISDVSFDSDRAPRLMKYYSGPGSLFGRFRNPVDSIFGYTSKDISERALVDFLSNVKKIPSSIKEVRLVAIGFSRGAAIARDFINRAHKSWESNNNASEVSMWSTLLLYDTVATFQQDTLQLGINPKSEQVVHLLSLNESRIDFRPIIDIGIGMANESSRVIEMNLPGSHSDVATGYRFGAGIYSDFLAHRVVQNMGLVEGVIGNYGPQPQYGFVDSRGWRDKLSNTPSGYACGFNRQAQKYVNYYLSSDELIEYKNRLVSRGSTNLSMSNSYISLRKNEPYVMIASSSKSEWKIVPAKADGLFNYPTMVQVSNGDNGTLNVKFVDGYEKNNKFILPKEVVNEIDYYKGSDVKLELTGLVNVGSEKNAPGFWFFVNGCIPSEGVLR